MKTMAFENLTPEVIQAAIYKERKRQLIERILEELAEENECYEGEISEAEMRVAIQLAMTGEGYASIGRKLHISSRTVQIHLGRVYAKTGCKTKALLQAAVTQKLLEMWADG